MSRCVVGWEVPDIWKDHTAFICRVKKSKADPLTQCNIPEDFSYTAVRNSNLTQTLFFLNTLRTGDADLRLYITTVRDGWCKSAFLTHAWCPHTIHLITQYREPLLEWFCWRMFIETWPHSEWMLCDKYWEQTALCFVQAFVGVAVRVMTSTALQPWWKELVLTRKISYRRW
jgi:hypothetical protein